MWRLTMTGRVRRKTTVNSYQTLDKWSVYKYIANITDLCNEEEGKYWMQFQLSTRVSLVFSDWLIFYKYSIRGSRGFLEFAKLNIADITGNEKISYFSYLCTSTVIRQGWSPPLEKLSGSAPVQYYIISTTSWVFGSRSYTRIRVIIVLGPLRLLCDKETKWVGSSDETIKSSVPFACFVIKRLNEAVPRTRP